MNDNLDHNRDSLIIEPEAPLAHRMRPRTLIEFIGQNHIMGPGRLLRRAIQADQLSSVIFYGPPGTGKTTLARVIANTTRSHFLTLNAVLAGVKDIREAISDALNRRHQARQRTTLFVDEVHRWNKAQQDALLPHVENGTIIMIGATTENPFFEVNKALLSRSRIFQLKALEPNDLRQVAAQALNDRARGYGELDVDLTADALEHLVNVANGDARSLLNALELAVTTTPPSDRGRITVDLTVAEESIQQRAVLYDREGDAHYDSISAFIKSLRGSDADAALYWMARMVYAGEDPRFIFRRMTIFAGEDIGMADPQAIVVVMSCWEAFTRIGMPEGRFPLAQAALYLATAPKSNSAFAFFDALDVVAREREAEVPNHLKDGNRDSEGFGHGQGYLYPHAYRDHWVAQQYLPEQLQGRLFYQPSDQGYERGIRETVARHREAQLEAMLNLAQQRQGTPAETLTFSPRDKGREAWLQRVLSQVGANLARQREQLFALLRVERHHRLLDAAAGSGLLTWEAVRRAPEGMVWALGRDAEHITALRQLAARLPELERPTIAQGSWPELPTSLLTHLADGLRFDLILGRNLLRRLTELSLWTAACRQCLAPAGRIGLIQVIPRATQRLVDLVPWHEPEQALAAQVRNAEEAIYSAAGNAQVYWGSSELETALRAAGWNIVVHHSERQTEQRMIDSAECKRWFSPSKTGRMSYAEHLAVGGLSSEQIGVVANRYRQQLADQLIPWQTTISYIIASLDEPANHEV